MEGLEGRANVQMRFVQLPSTYLDLSFFTHFLCTVLVNTHPEINQRVGKSFLKKSVDR